MNGFRVTILTLLCLSVALMFYVVLYVIPSWQVEYNTYQSTMRISEYDKKSDMHRRQMQALDPSVESPEEEQARLAEEEADRRNEQNLQEAEERIIVEAAKHREEAAQAKARAEAEAKALEEAKAASAQPATVGLVASYDEEWSCIMIKPAVVGAFGQGNTLAVRRGNTIICEAVVDGLDVESGQVSATVKMEQFGAAPSSNMVPVPGDEVIISPFLSGDDLRNAFDKSVAPQSVNNAPLPEAPAAFDTLPQTPAGEPGAVSAPVPAPQALPDLPAEPEQMDSAPKTPAELPVNAPVEPSPAAPVASEPAPVEPVAAPALQEDPAAVEPAPSATRQEEAPAPDEVQRALNAVPSAPARPRSDSGNNSSLPSLDAMLHSSLF